MNLKTGNTRFLLICAGIVLVSIGTFGYFTWSDMEEMDELQQDTEALTKKTQKADLDIKNIPSLEDRVLILREQVKKDVAILPDDQEIHAFVDKLTEFERSSGVRVTKLDDTQARQRRNSRRRSTKAFESITYKLTLQGTTSELLAFMDLLENKYERFVRFPALKVQAYDERTVVDDPAKEVTRRHSIDLELETYVYNPKKRGKDHVEIPGEEHKLERLREDNKLGRSGAEFAVIRYDIKPKPERRDPFVDPRLDLPGNNRLTEEERREQRRVLTSLKDTLQGIRDAIAEEPREANTILRMQLEEKNNGALKSFASEVNKRAEEKFFTAAEFAKEFQSHVLLPTNQLMTERRQGITTEVSAADIKTRVDDMRKAAGAQDWGAVVTKNDEIKQLLEKLEAPASVRPLLDEARTLVQMATAHRDFDALEMEFGGAVTYEADPLQAVVIINGRAFSPTETVSDGLTIKTITKTSVVFSYRGYEMSRRHAN